MKRILSIILLFLLSFSCFGYPLEKLKEKLPENIKLTEKDIEEHNKYIDLCKLVEDFLNYGHFIKLDFPIYEDLYINKSSIKNIVVKICYIQIFYFEENSEDYPYDTELWFSDWSITTDYAYNLIFTDETDSHLYY